MSKKYQIFVSSTYEDLKMERDQVIKSILEMGHIPVGMEMFSAADEEQWKIIARQIDEIDYYVLILAHRYGSVTAEGTSYTEKEFDYAIAQGVPILSFVISDKTAWPKEKSEKEVKGIRKLEEFKAKAKTRLIKHWSSSEELYAQVSISLMKAITANPRTGWVRATQLSGPEVTNELTRLSSENAQLRKEVTALKTVNSEEASELHKTVKILVANKKFMRVRPTVKWDNASEYEVTLANLFSYCGPNLIGENDANGIAKNIALHTIGTDYYSNFPIATNVISSLLADFVALDLVEPSKKKHPVSDKTIYWSLTKYGREVHKSLRRVMLEAGVPSPTDSSRMKKSTKGE
jgi:hypothetical protein